MQTVNSVFAKDKAMKIVLDKVFDLAFTLLDRLFKLLRAFQLLKCRVFLSFISFYDRSEDESTKR